MDHDSKKGIIYIDLNIADNGADLCKTATYIPQLVAITHTATALFMMMVIQIDADGQTHGFSDQALQLLGLNEEDLQQIMAEMVDLLEDEDVFSSKTLIDPEKHVNGHFLRFCLLMKGDQVVL